MMSSVDRLEFDAWLLNIDFLKPSKPRKQTKKKKPAHPLVNRLNELMSDIRPSTPPQLPAYRRINNEANEGKKNVDFKEEVVPPPKDMVEEDLLPGMAKRIGQHTLDETVIQTPYEMQQQHQMFAKFASIKDQQNQQDQELQMTRILEMSLQQHEEEQFRQLLKVETESRDAASKKNTDVKAVVPQVDKEHQSEDDAIEQAFNDAQLAASLKEHENVNWGFATDEDGNAQSTAKDEDGW
jgi:hypothetical protein